MRKPPSGPEPKSKGARLSLDAHSVLEEFVNDIELTGGVFKDKNGWYTLVADPDWIDLAETYVKACRVLGRKPALVDQPEVDL